MRKISKLFLALLAVASLSFAATEVFATTNSCPNNGGYPYLGECVRGDAGCAASCTSVHGEFSTGHCDLNNCCVCAY